jgi:hypothetical protein
MFRDLLSQCIIGRKLFIDMDQNLTKGLFILTESSSNNFTCTRL